MNKHENFILAPITSNLEIAVTSCAGIGHGIETFPLCDYIMQSIFLKMTGFQEQKMKCICWDLATDDYDYRYRKFRNGLGECSQYKDKNNIYIELVEQIKKHAPSYSLADEEREKILNNTTKKIDEIFQNTNLLSWNTKKYYEFKDIWKTIKIHHFAKDALFSAENKNNFLKEKIYEKHLYRHRNRCAHNILCVQQHLPSLKTLVDNDYKYENYFLWFATLSLIDNIFINLYKKYLDLHNKN